jgi:aspartyl-tRNA(Asn)/glutamyl-tRNA(Gln) amidotransferase subunit A
MAPLDAVVLPTVPCPAFPHGERHPHNTAELTAVATGAALPAVSLPLPVPAGELPIGLQLIGHRGGELDLAALAVELEAALGGRRQ